MPHDPPDIWLLDFKASLARLREDLAAARLFLIERKYSADQPRVPAGSSDGGRWVSSNQSESDGQSRLLQLASLLKKPRTVNLAEEEAAGGHAIARHVDIPNGQLTARVASRDISTSEGKLYYALPVGSFDSVESANYYVNEVLAQNSDVVDAVSSGQRQDEFLTARFDHPTGREARREYRLFGIGPIVIRPTFWVGLKIKHVSGARGFRVVTAFPMNGGSPDED